MFTLIHNLYSWQKEQRKKEKTVRIILVGLDNAGKTTINFALRGEIDSAPARPTVGFDQKKAQEGKFAVTYYDVGGGKKIRDIWSRYYAEVHGIIFVVDAADSARLDEARATLHTTLGAECVPGKPVLIFANKQDLPQALSAAELSDRLGMHTFKNVKHQIFPSVALTKEGQAIDPNIKKALGWLLNAIDSDFQRLSKVVAADYAKQLEQAKIAREEQKVRAAAARAQRLKEQAEEEKRKAEEEAAKGTNGETSNHGENNEKHVEGSGVAAEKKEGTYASLDESRNNNTGANDANNNNQQQRSHESNNQESDKNNNKPDQGAASTSNQPDETSSTIVPIRKPADLPTLKEKKLPPVQPSSLSFSSSMDISPARVSQVEAIEQGSNPPTASASLPSLNGGGGVIRGDFSARLPPILSSSPSKEDREIDAVVELPNMIMSPPKQPQQ